MGCEFHFHHDTSLNHISEALQDFLDSTSSFARDDAVNDRVLGFGVTCGGIHLFRALATHSTPIQVYGGLLSPLLVRLRPF